MKTRDIVVVLTIGAASRTAGDAYILRLKSKAEPKDLVKAISAAIREAYNLRGITQKAKPPEDPEKAKARQARATKKAETEARKAARAERRAAREAEKRHAEFERATKRREREERKAAIVARREKRAWLKGAPEQNDVVEYQEKPKGRWKVGRVIGAAHATGDLVDQRYKVAGERGTHYYPAAQVKRTDKSLRG